MDVTLISRYFDNRTNGIGNYSKLVSDSLKINNNINLNLVSMQNNYSNKLNSIMYFYFIFFKLKFILQNDKYKNSDIFHAMTPLESIHINKRKGVTNILDLIPFHEDGTTFHNNNIARLYSKCMKSAIKSERIIVFDSSMREELNKRFGVDESIIEIVKPPISGDFFPKNEKHDTYNIGTLCGLDPRKRVDILIKSFIDADIENSRLYIGGIGSQMENLKQIAGNDERIKFFGYIPDEEINNFYNLLDVFVFPTSLEGYGMPIVEAMGAGKPVITLDDAIIPGDLANHTHITTKNNLSNTLAERNFKCDIKENLRFYKQHSINEIGPRIYKVYESI